MKTGKTLFIIFCFLLIFSLFAGISLKKDGFDHFIPSTRLANEEVSIEGLSPFPDKETTNVIIIHGIGTHCIGYADEMIKDLLTNLTDQKPKDTRSIYTDYLTKRLSAIRENEDAKLYAPRDGLCKIDLENEQSVEYMKKLLAVKEDRAKINNASGLEELINQNASIFEKITLALKTSFSMEADHSSKPSVPIKYTIDDPDAIVSSQESFCRYIHETSDPTIDCYRLYVDKKKELLKDGEDSKYITGFVRKISGSSAGHRLNIYELTWSPAVRWLKESFHLSEIVSEDFSRHVVNKNIKATVVNNAIADAVAYLSDSGVLVNFDVLQTFCLNLATWQSNNKGTAFDFACEKEIDSPLVNFSTTNEVVLISHSLGSRILLDSLGLLSRGADSTIEDEKTTLVGVIKEKFDRIGAVVSPYYTDPTTSKELGFTEFLHSRILDYMKSIRSIYLLTNQIPLLTANITSPLTDREPIKVSDGFDNFIDERYKQTGNQLQIYSFHDPDDVLSYNFKCWFHMNILKDKETTKDFLWNEAEKLAIKNGTDQGNEYRELRTALFDTTCSRSELSDSYQSLYDKIWNMQNSFEMVDATVRLNNKRIPFLVADPGGIHSNYFIDRTIHKWLLTGNNPGGLNNEKDH